MVARSRPLNAALPAAILFATLAAGCASSLPGRSPDGRQPARGQETGRETGEGTLGAAGASLLSQARAERAAADLAAASLTLERALRIEPQQPALWLELARVRLDEGNFAQAEQLARKACALAPARSSPANRCGELIEEAGRRAGRGASGNAQ